jgi:prevent-host-death family protein
MQYRSTQFWRARTIPASEFKRDVKGNIDRLQEGPLMLTNYGVQVAVVLSLEEYDRLVEKATE